MSAYCGSASGWCSTRFRFSRPSRQTAAMIVSPGRKCFHGEHGLELANSTSDSLRRAVRRGSFLPSMRAPSGTEPDAVDLPGRVGASKRAVSLDQTLDLRFQSEVRT